MPDAGKVWLALTDLHAQTGLVPILLADDEGSSGYFFDQPADVADVDRLDADQVLAALWKYKMPDEESDQWEGGRLSAMHAPFSQQFPGLAPPTSTTSSTPERRRALSTVPPARVGLVAAQRPADVLPIVGWTTFDEFYQPVPVSNAIWIAAILRSWEDRFAATLLNVGPRTQIRLLVGRPPETLEAAQRIAAEHYAFADRFTDRRLRDIPGIAAALIDASIWTFWWS